MRQSGYEDMKRMVAQAMPALCEDTTSNGLRGPLVPVEAFSLADANPHVACRGPEGGGADLMATFPTSAAFRAGIQARPSQQAARAAGTL